MQLHHSALALVLALVVTVANAQTGGFGCFWGALKNPAPESGDATNHELWLCESSLPGTIPPQYVPGEGDSVLFSSAAPLPTIVLEATPESIDPMRNSTHVWSAMTLQSDVKMLIKNPCTGVTVLRHSETFVTWLFDLTVAGNQNEITYDDTQVVGGALFRATFRYKFVVESGMFRFNTPAITTQVSELTLGSTSAELARPQMTMRMNAASQIENPLFSFVGGNTEALFTVDTVANEPITWDAADLTVNRQGGGQIMRTGSSTMTMTVTTCNIDQGRLQVQLDRFECGATTIMAQGSLVVDAPLVTFESVDGGDLTLINSNTTVTGQLQSGNLDVRNSHVMTNSAIITQLAISGMGSFSTTTTVTIDQTNIPSGSYTFAQGKFVTDTWSTTNPVTVTVAASAEVDIRTTATRIVAVVAGKIVIPGPLVAQDSLTGDGQVFLSGGTFTGLNNIATTLGIVINGAAVTFTGTIDNTLSLQSGTVTFNDQTLDLIFSGVDTDGDKIVVNAGTITVPQATFEDGSSAEIGGGTLSATLAQVNGGGSLAIASGATLTTSEDFTFNIGTGNTWTVTGDGTWNFKRIIVTSGRLVIDMAAITGVDPSAIQAMGSGEIEFTGGQHTISNTTISDNGKLVLSTNAMLTGNTRIDSGAIEVVASTNKRQATATLPTVLWAGGTLSASADTILAITSLTIEETAVGKTIQGDVSVSSITYGSGTSFSISNGIGASNLIIGLPLTFMSGVTHNYAIGVVFNNNVTIENGADVTLGAVTQMEMSTMIINGGDALQTDSFDINGILRGTGTIGGEISLSTNGIIDLGAEGQPPPQTIRIEGTYSQAGTLIIDAGGEVSDSVAVTGAAFLGGTLILRLESNITALTLALVSSDLASNNAGRFADVIGGDDIRITYGTGARIARSCAALGECSPCVSAACGWCAAADWPSEDRCLETINSNCTDFREVDQCELDAGGSNVPAIVVPIVIVIVVLIAILVVYFVLRGKGGGGTSNAALLKNKPPQPDFTPIAFGDLVTANHRVARKDQSRIASLSELRDLILADDLKLAEAVADVTKSTDQDNVARALVYITESERSSIDIIKHFISREISSATANSTLFRSNSMASKMLKFYSKLIGLQYLWNTLSDDIHIVMETLKAQGAGDVSHNSGGDGFTFELDPHLKEDWQDIRINKYQLLLTAQKILTHITRSLNKVPIEFRILCAHLQREMTAKFPDSKNTAIGGFIFLRLINPAINLPESYGLSRSAPSKEARRVFVLITKTLQSLANGIELGGKEPYMAKLNEFIDDNQEEIFNWFDDIASMPSGHSEDEDVLPTSIPPDVEAVALAHVYKHVYTNRNKISESLDSTLRAQINSIIDRVGEPLEISSDKK